MPEWKIERLDRKHERKQFTCSKPTLDNYIWESALSHQKQDLSRTYVAVRPGEVAVRGYYTISNCQVEHESLPLPHGKKSTLRMMIPAVRLGRLAVDVSFQKQGLGGMLLIQALRRTLDLSRQCGCALLTLDTREEEASNFYIKYGFVPHSDSMPGSFYLPVKTIAQMTLRPIVEEDE